MSLQTFVQRHYSPTAGESPLGHAVVVVAGFALMAVGTFLVASIVWIPAGVVIGLVGLLALIGGVWAHISKPVNLSELADSAVKLTGAAIAMAFGLAVMAMIVGFALTVLVSLIRLIAG